MPDRRPPADQTRGAALLLASARERLSVALEDLRLPEHLRLSEWQRATVASLRSKLVRQVEEELRTQLAGLLPESESALGAALTSADVAIAEPILLGSAALADRDLTSAFLRRAEEHRLFRSGAADDSFLLDLSGDEDEVLAGQAMTLLITQSSRFDPFQDPLMGRTELAAELQHQLVWTVAAALRRYMIEQHGFDGAAADEALATAAGRLLADYDEAESVEMLALRLALRLREAGRLGDGLIAATLNGGGLPLFLASLAARTGLDTVAVWEIGWEPSGRGMVLLLRAADLSRASAGAILLRLEGEESRLAAKLDLFDAIDGDEARRLIRLWRLDPAYRAAIARLAA